MGLTRQTFSDEVDCAYVCARARVYARVSANDKIIVDFKRKSKIPLYH